MNQTKYKQWVKSSFVPTVKFIFGTNMKFSSGDLRRALIGYAPVMIIKDCLDQYNELLASQRGPFANDSWKLTDFTDRVRRALETACNMDLLAPDYDGLIRQRTSGSSGTRATYCARRRNLRFQFLV